MSDNIKKNPTDSELDQILSDALNKKNKKSDAPEADGADKEIRRERRDTDQPRNTRPRRERPSDGERRRPSDRTASDGDRPRKKKPGPEGVAERTASADKAKRKRPSDADTYNRSNKNSSSGKKRKRKKWTSKQKILLISGIIFLVLCLMGLGIYLVLHHYWSMMKHDWKDSVTSERPPELSSVERPDLASSNTFNVEDADEKLRKHLEENAVELMKDQDVFNILLIGQDLRSSSSNDRGNTDVMMIVSINKKSKTITMTSLMRDIWLYLPDAGYSNRLNAAYWHGGPDYLVNTVEAYFGVKIDRYVNITFNSFIKVVDTLGGVDVFVKPEEAMGYEGANPYEEDTRGMQNPLDEQNRILGNPKGTDYIIMDYSEKGRTLHLNGNQALAYARLRYVGNSDFERTERQRKILSYVIEKVKNASLSELNDLANAVLKDITTTITEGETFSLLLNALDYANYDIQEMRIPEEGTYSGHFIRGNSVLLCNTVKNAKDLQMLVYGKTNVDESQLKQYEQQNKYLDDNGNWIDYYSDSNQ